MEVRFLPVCFGESQKTRRSNMQKLKELIEKQQKGKKNSPEYMVGMQILDIVGKDESMAEMVAQDLEKPEMNLSAAAAEIKKYADANHGKSSSFCVPPDVAEGILRKFYGLPEAGEEKQVDVAQAAVNLIDLDDYI